MVSSAPVCHFEYVAETDGFQCTEYFLYRLFELGQHGGGHHSHYLSSFLDAVQHIEYGTLVEYGTERTSVQAFAAIDTFFRVDMLYAVFVFGNGFHGTSLFARHRNVHDSVVRAYLMAPAATDTFFVVDVGFPFAVVVNGIFRTVVVARPRGTATAQVRYLVVDFHARRARFVHYAEDTFLRIDFFSFHHAGGVGRQTFGFVGFIRHVEAHHGHGLVFCHCTFFIHAAASQRFLLAWMQFHRQPVYFFQ